MAIKRTSSNSLVNATKMSTGFSSAAIPNTPTIGAATAVDDVSATVAYTAAVLGANGVTFTATSNPSSITGTGSSPITVTGLTASTSYTFSVTSGNANGTSAASSASNSITTNAPLTSSYYSIASYTAATDISSLLTMSNIDQTYKDLVIVMQMGATYAGNGGGSGGKFYFNTDNTNGNYYAFGLYGNGNGSAGGVTVGGSSGAQFDFSAHWAGNLNDFAPAIWTISDYASTTKFKSVKQVNGASLTSSNGTNSNTGIGGGVWRSTAAINALNFYHVNGVYGDGNLRAGSTITIFGVK